MPVRFQIEPSRRLVISVWEGEVTLAESLEHNERLREHPDFDPSFDQLSDARAVTVPVDADGIAVLARRPAFGPGSRRAMVVASDLLYGVSRMYEARTLQGGPTVRVFRDLDEAQKWLLAPEEAVV